MLRPFIATTAIVLAGFITGCAVNQADANVATSSPATDVSSPTASTSTQAAGVELSATSIGEVVIGEASQDEVIAYLNQALGQKGKPSDESYCDGCKITLTDVAWKGLNVTFAADGERAGQLLRWYVFGAKAPARLQLSSGLAMDATVAEVQAAYPDAELKQASYKTDWTITDPATGIEFLWRSTKQPAADKPAYEVSSPFTDND